MKKALVLALLLCAFVFVNAQRGKNGDKTITAAATVVNEYTTLTASVTAGQSTITVASNTLTGAAFSTPLAKGDLVMIIQMQGAAIKHTADDSTYGEVTAYNNAGLYEYAEVLGVSGGQQITLVCALQNNYTDTGKVQVVRVPRYNTLTINSGADITCPGWDGAKGGVVAIEVLGNINIAGRITATGKGFRGGLANENQSTNGVLNWRSPDAQGGGEKGEGIAGYVTKYDLIHGRYGMGAPANGGGGGNGHNAGGGGGANGGNIALYNGKGNPNNGTNNAYAPAWDLEGNSFSTSTSSGGGRGGYTFSANNQNALTTAPYASGWGGDFRNNVGGRGGRPLVQNAGSRLFLGGGGGAGDQNDGTAGDGGTGGGLIYICSFGDISGTGSIEAHGSDGQNSGAGFTQGVDGGGGGGGGGTICIKATGTLTGVVLGANGGVGGDVVKVIGNDAYGPGGGGGGGYICTIATAVVREVLGGANGTSTLVTMSEFPPNGATIGAAGVVEVTPIVFDIVAQGDTACNGQQVTLQALTTGIAPTGYSIEWYDAQGNNIGSGPSLQYNFTQPETVYAYTCPGWFSAAAYVVGGTLPAAGFSYTDNGGFNVTFTNSSTDATTYSWNFGDGSPVVTDAQPLHHYPSEGNYTVTLIAENSCGSDTIIQQITVIKVGVNESALEAVKIVAAQEPGVYYIQTGTVPCNQLNITITDVAGRTLQQKQLTGGNIAGPIDISAYPQGLYLLTFNCHGKMYYGKLIVK